MKSVACLLEAVMRAAIRSGTPRCTVAAEACSPGRNAKNESGKILGKTDWENWVGRVRIPVL